MNFAEAARFLVATSDAEELSIRRALDRHLNVNNRWQGRTFIGLGRGLPVVMLAAALAGESAGLDLIERFEGFEVQEQGSGQWWPELTARAEPPREGREKAARKRFHPRPARSV